MKLLNKILDKSKLFKMIGFVFLFIVISFVNVNSIDFNNISFTQQEFLTTGITGSVTKEINNTHNAVYYISGGVTKLKICEIGNSCGTEYTIDGNAGSTSIDMLVDLTNNQLILFNGRNTNSGQYEFNLTSNTATFIRNFNIGATDFVSADIINNTHFAVGYVDLAVSNAARIIFGTLDGNSIGTEVNIQGSNSGRVKIKTLSDNTLAYFFELTTDGRGFLYKLDFNGGFGLSWGVINTGGTKDISLIEGSDNRLKLVFQDTGNLDKGTFLDCALADGTCNSPIIFYNLHESLNSLIQFKDKLFIFFKDIGLDGKGYTYNFNLTGGNISTKQNFSAYNNADSISSYLSLNNQIITSYGDISNGKGKFAISEILIDKAIISINNPVDNSVINTLTFPLNVSTDLNTNLSYIFNGGSEISLCNNCNSSTNITFTGVEGLNNLTILSNFNTALTNSISTFTIDTINPYLIVNLPTEFNFYNGFNFSSYINFSDTNIGTCIVTISGESSTTCSQMNYNFTLNGNKTINVTAKDLAGNQVTQNGITLINPLQYFYFTYFNGTSITNFSFNNVLFNTFASFKTYNDNLILGSNNLTFEKLGFATTPIVFNLNTSGNINLTSNITSSSINLRIFNGDTGNILTGLSTITLVATTGFNSTTTTGYLNISDINFLSESYQIIINHDGYATETVYFDYNNQEILNKDIYMLNNTGTNYGTITLEVTAANQFVDNAICKALEWKASDSAYISVAEGLTNIQGKTNLNIHIGTELYKFQCSKSGQLTTTNSQIIQTTGQTLPISLQLSSILPVNSLGSFSYNLTNSTVNNTHQLITYVFNDASNLVNNVCINEYKRTGTKTTLLSQNCTSSSSGTLYKLVNINNSYTKLVSGLVTINSIDTLIQTISFKGTGDLSFSLKQYNLDILLPLAFLIIGIIIGLALKPQNIYISIISSIIMVWFSVLIVPTVISTSIALFVTFICVLMLYGGQKKV